MIDKPVTNPEEAKSQSVVNIERPAGFWIRGDAFVIDLLSLYMIRFILGIEGIIYMFIVVFVVAFIFPVFIWKGQTLGKHLAGIVVVNNNGAQLNPSQIIVRYAMSHVFPISLVLFYTTQSIPVLSLSFQLILGFLLFAVWFIPVAFHNKRTLYDYITGTRVFYIHEIGLLRKAGIVCVGTLGFIWVLLEILYSHIY